MIKKRCRQGFAGGFVEISDIQVHGRERVALNELASGIYLVTHQGSEHVVTDRHIIDMHLDQGTVGRVHGGFPKLFGIHFTKTLVAL